MNDTIRATCRKPHAPGTFRQSYDILYCPVFKGAILPIGRVVDIEYLFPTGEENRMDVFDYDYMIVKVKRPVYTRQRVYAVDSTEYIATPVDPDALFDEWWPRGFAAQNI